MALSAASVTKACSILHQIIPALNEGLHPFNKESPIRPGLIIGLSPKEDGGYENIFTDVENLSPAQEQLFITLKGGIGHSYIIGKGDGVTQIGWF